MEVVSEDDVYDEFEDGRMKNFAVVIEGEVGTRKSELCAYLAHRLRDDGRPLLHVDKEDDLMSLLQRDPGVLPGPVRGEMPGCGGLQTAPGRHRVNPAGGRDERRLQHDSQPRAARVRGLYLEDQDDDIAEFIRDKLQLLVERGQYATEVTFVTEQEVPTERVPADIL